jgi:actin-like ATPase involved in cell morphogenesis
LPETVSVKVIAVGKEIANMMQGKTQQNLFMNNKTLEDVITDFDASEKMDGMLKKHTSIEKKRMFTNFRRMVVCIPSGITTEVEIESGERIM